MAKQTLNVVYPIRLGLIHIKPCIYTRPGGTNIIITVPGTLLP